MTYHDPKTTAAINDLLNLIADATRPGAWIPQEALTAVNQAATGVRALLDQPEPKAEDKNESAREQARAQLSSIKEMVAAYLCDYDRLEELKEEKADLVEAAQEAADDLSDNDDISQVEDLTNALTAAETATMDWMAEYQEELAELMEAAGDCADQEEARQRIEEDALSVQVRSDWHSPGEDAEDSEFEILLCTGGPAVKIWGELNQYKEPDRALIYFQDWFTSWEELILNREDAAAVLEYCRCFYFGE